MRAFTIDSDDNITAFVSTCGVLGRIDLLAALAAQDADEAAFIIPERVAPFARFISAITSAFLLVRSDFGLLAAFLAWPAFFTGLASWLACVPSLDTYRIFVGQLAP
jgi:hypothetical protein